MTATSEKTTLMTEGSIGRKIIAFALPLFLGNLFQQLYNTADSLIVGNFLGSNALAAVSSSGNLIFLMVGFFHGIAARRRRSHRQILWGERTEISKKSGTYDHCFRTRRRNLSDDSRRPPHFPYPHMDGNAGGRTAGIYRLFPHLFYGFPLLRYVQCIRGNPAIRRRQQTPSCLSDRIFCY